MELKWLERNPIDSEGEHFHIHYLVDALSSRCFATIADPRKGHILYETNIRVSDIGDRCYVTLEAARAYCEYAAHCNDNTQAEDLKKLVEAKPDPKEEPAPRPTSAWWYDE